MYDPFGVPQIPKRNVFVSYFNADATEVGAFLATWADQMGVFTPKVIGVGAGRLAEDSLINSGDSEYVMGRIRSEYLGDSTVTLLFVGPCTHSRRYIDWELKSSLRQGLVYTPNGLLAILLPSAAVTAKTTGRFPALPPRFLANFRADGQCYGRYYYAPRSPDELRIWIEDAFAARSTRARLISNSAEMMKYNAKCQACGITHPA